MKDLVEMVTAEERLGLEEIRTRRRRAKYHALAFVGVSVAGAVPTGKGPVVLRPLGLIAVMTATGVLYHMAGLLMMKLVRARCPRCGHRFFAARHGFILGRIARSLWASHCQSCGLGFGQMTSAS